MGKTAEQLAADIAASERMRARRMAHVLPFIEREEAKLGRPLRVDDFIGLDD